MSKPHPDSQCPNKRVSHAWDFLPGQLWDHQGTSDGGLGLLHGAEQAPGRSGLPADGGCVPQAEGGARSPGEPGDNPSHGTILWLIPAHSRLVLPWVRPLGVTCPSGPQSHSEEEFSSSSWKTEDPPRTGWREGQGKGPAGANVNPTSSTPCCPPQRRQTAAT